MYTKNSNGSKPKFAVQHLAFGVSKPTAPYTSGTATNQRAIGDPSSVRQCCYAVPGTYNQPYRAAE